MNDEKDNLEFRLGQYLDGQLDPTDALELEKRLLREPDTRRQLGQYARLEEMLMELRLQRQLEKVDFDLERQTIMGKLERRALMRPPTRLPFIRVAFGAMAAAAAVVLLTTAAMMIFRSWGTGPVGPNTVASMIKVTMPLAAPLAAAGMVQSAMPRLAQPQQVSVNYSRVQDVDIPITPKDAYGQGQEVPQAEEPGLAIMFHGARTSSSSDGGAMDPLMLE